MSEFSQTCVGLPCRLDQFFVGYCYPKRIMAEPSGPIMSVSGLDGHFKADFVLPGIESWGRHLLRYTDMRVSRNQIQINIWPDRVFANRRGNNLSCLHRENGGEVLEMEKDTEYQLFAGDTLYLLVSLYPIRINSVLSSTTPSEPTTSEIVVLSEETVEINGTKRSHDSISPVPTGAAVNGIDSDEESEEVIVLSKKPKLSEQVLEEVTKMESPIGQIKIQTSSTTNWNHGLLVYLKAPEAHLETVVKITERIVVIKDKWPKAKLHLLILPRLNLPNPSHLTAAHIPLLEEMIQVAEDISKQWLSNKQGEIKDETGKVLYAVSHSLQTKSVKIGFHAVPSMSQIHLHVISDDMDSDGMKTKKHWNSFTQTKFFVSPNDFLQKLKAGQVISYNKTEYEALLDLPLKCHRCSTSISNIPNLKSHIKNCNL